ncbi:MAG: TetR/AcrR family transcriptional regulator [Erythrobacter sp.]
MSARKELETVGENKIPRTERGRRTLRKLLDASAIEFGEKGFHEASVSSITLRAGVALGTFYTYFDSKDALFRALVQDMSGQVKAAARGSVEALMKGPSFDAFDIEQVALVSFLDFAREHKEIYRIIDESEFVDPQAHRSHYEATAERILSRLREGAGRGEIRGDVQEAHAWALMGMNVFLGLRFAVWSDDQSSESIAKAARSILERGLAPGDEGAHRS